MSEVRIEPHLRPPETPEKIAERQARYATS